MQGLPSRSLLLAALAMAVFQWGIFVAVGALGAVTAEGNRAPKAGPRGLVTTGGALTGAGVLLAPVALRSSWPATTARSLATLLSLGCVATALAYALFASGLRALTADRTLG
jgi:drug/metabolite transporter (DMT)-like permease